MIKLPACESIGAYDSLSHDEWLQLRTLGIGGSDAGGIMGYDDPDSFGTMSKYSSKLSIWMDKTGRSKPEDFEDNEPIWFGNWIEAKIRNELVAPYIKKHMDLDVEVIAPTHMYRSIENPFMIINVDGFLRVSLDCPKCEGSGELSDETRGPDEWFYPCPHCKNGRITILVGLEIKTGNSYVLSQWGGKDGNEIPDSYYCQVQHYMAGTGLDEFWVFGLIGNNRLLRIVPRNNEFIERLIEAERNLWEKVVLNDVLFAPMPSGSDSDMEALFTLGSPQEDSTVDLSDVNKDIVDYDYYRQQIIILQEAKEQSKQKIIATMGTSKYGESERYKLTFSRFDRSNFNKGKFEKDNPGMMDDYITYNESGRLSIKSI